MTWRCNKPGHQYPTDWSSLPGIYNHCRLCPKIRPFEHMYEYRMQQLTIEIVHPHSAWVGKPGTINSLSFGRCGSNFNSTILKLIIQNISLSIHCKIAFGLMPQNLTNEKSTVLQVMASCHQATNHYLSQYGPISVSPSGDTRPQQVNNGDTRINSLCSRVPQSMSPCWSLLELLTCYIAYL